ncbi:hypothetical protein CGZ75_11850 [Paenibacillus herberti]|uniref:Uncharacterized protein n=1 Tax=Paenibacillus herberti TaxID=1619309 RepID=A0A229P5C6_9BACL|nr:hypothetical protein CGZ75_11850 [Paenibacillus herberti]
MRANFLYRQPRIQLLGFEAGIGLALAVYDGPNVCQQVRKLVIVFRLTENIRATSVAPPLLNAFDNLANSFRFFAPLREGIFL